MKAAMIFFGVCVLLVGVVGAGTFFLWKKQGSPSLADWKARIVSGEEEGTVAEVVNLAPRPVVSSVPIPAGSDTYARFLKRKDVLTLVNYYSDT
jgi:hypothetical protein